MSSAENQLKPEASEVVIADIESVRQFLLKRHGEQLFLKEFVWKARVFVAPLTLCVKRMMACIEDGNEKEARGYEQCCNVMVQAGIYPDPDQYQRGIKQLHKSRSDNILGFSPESLVLYRALTYSEAIHVDGFAKWAVRDRRDKYDFSKNEVFNSFKE